MSESASERDRIARLPLVFAGFGVALLLVLLGEGVILSLGSGGAFDPADIVGIATALPFVVGIIGGSYWLYTSDISPARYRRVGGWFLSGTLIFVGINVAVMVVQPPETVAALWGWLRWAGSIGGAVGLLTGIVEARAIERERAAERAAVRAEIAETERDLLDYVNSLLRHEALNAANVISGNAGLLMERDGTDESARERLRVIQAQSDDLARIIEDVRVLLRGAGETGRLEAWSLQSVLDAEAAALRERTGAEVTVTGDTDVTVTADNLLARLFSNILANAVEHNDSDTPVVEVTAEKNADTVTVEISDNGPGIDADRLEGLFDRDPDENSSHHLGLFLVRSLAERYGGEVRVAETSPEGTTVAVELRRADADSGDGLGGGQ